MAEDTLSEEFFMKMRSVLGANVSPARLRHSEEVARMAVCLAEAYGTDARRARLAGLLHDWDKGFSDEEIRKRALRFGIAVDGYVLETMPRLLHGPTAAAALGREFPGIDREVLQAIERHTSAEIGMSDLDMVIYVADVIEPGRPFDEMADIREAIGTVSLEELFLETFQHVVQTLVGRRRRMHPRTVAVWNYYVGRACAPRSPRSGGC